MAAWHHIIKTNHAKILDFITHFEKELTDAKSDVDIRGGIEQLAMRLPGIFEYRYGQLQEVEATIDMLDTQLKKIRSEKFRMYLEKYNRQLSSSDAWKYCDGEPDVCDLCDLINEVALIRNRYLGITKALEQKSFMIGHIVKMRAVGIEDATL